MPPLDTGVVRTAEDATRFAAMTSPQGGDLAAVGVGAAAARSGFARTSAVLGVPPIPSAPGPSLLDRAEPPEPREDPRRERQRPRPR